MVGALAVATATSRGGKAVGFLLPGDGVCSRSKVCVCQAYRQPGPATRPCALVLTRQYIPIFKKQTGCFTSRTLQTTDSGLYRDVRVQLLCKTIRNFAEAVTLVDECDDVQLKLRTESAEVWYIINLSSIQEFGYPRTAMRTALCCCLTDGVPPDVRL